jgi:hypothetical protein
VICSVGQPTDWDGSRREIFPFGQVHDRPRETERTKKSLAAKSGNMCRLSVSKSEAGDAIDNPPRSTPVAT